MIKQPRTPGRAAGNGLKKKDNDMTVTTRHITVLLLAVLASMMPAPVSAQAPDAARDGVIEDAKIYFRLGSSVLERDFRDNGTVLDAFIKGINNALAEGKAVEGVLVETGASPEGGVEYNDRLAMDRARSIRKYLIDNLPLSAIQIKAYSVGADWEGLTVSLRESDCPWKDEILAIIADTGVRTNYDVKSRQRCQDRIRAIDGGKAWTWMLDNLFSDLRQGAGKLRCIIADNSSATSVRDTLVIVHEYEGPDAEWILSQASKKAADVSAAAVLQKIDIKPSAYSARDSLFRIPVAAVRTNLLVPAMNVGFEVPLGDRFSVGADWYYPWVWRQIMNGIAASQSQCFQLLGGCVEARYWIGRNHRNREDCHKYRLRGHSVGLVASGGYYDLQSDWEGRQGEYLAFGLGYKYALPLGKGNVHLEFEAAAGYGMSWYRGYKVHEPGGRLMGNWNDGFWNGFVPIKFGINLAFPFFGKENKSAKED